MELSVENSVVDGYPMENSVVDGYPMENSAVDGYGMDDVPTWATCNRFNRQYSQDRIL
jgi:hypothetical protein